MVVVVEAQADELFFSAFSRSSMHRHVLRINVTMCGALFAVCDMTIFLNIFTEQTTTSEMAWAVA